eukprot:jgi/Mesen1/5638/ME000285S04921
MGCLKGLQVGFWHSAYRSEAGLRAKELLRWRRVSYSSESLSQLPQGFNPPPPVPQRRVVITGLGLVTPLGTGVEASWQKLIAGGCGIRAISANDLKLSGVEDDAREKILQQLTSRVGATVKEGQKEGEFDSAMWRPGRQVVPPFVSYALCSAAEALADARWRPESDSERERTGVAIGGGIGCISEIVDAAGLLLSKGPNHAAVTACASGAHALGDAARMIRHSDADVMVAGGAEASVDALSIAGFCRCMHVTWLLLQVHASHVRAHTSRLRSRAARPFVHLCVYPLVRLSIQASDSLFVRLTACSSICLSVCLFVSSTQLSLSCLVVSSSIPLFLRPFIPSRHSFLRPLVYFVPLLVPTICFVRSICFVQLVRFFSACPPLLEQHSPPPRGPQSLKS